MCGVAGSSGSGSFTRPLIECQLELQSSLGLTGAESTSRSTHWLLAGFSSLRIVVLRTTVPSWLLARGCPQYLATGPPRHQKLLAPSEPAEEQAAAKLGASIFCHLSTRVAAHHLCHILLMRSKSRGPGHRQGEGITGNESQGEERIFGTILEVTYFSVLLSRSSGKPRPYSRKESQCWRSAVWRGSEPTCTGQCVCVCVCVFCGGY